MARGWLGIFQIHSSKLELQGKKWSPNFEIWSYSLEKMMMVIDWRVFREKVM